MPKVLFCLEKLLDAAHPEWGGAVHDYGVAGSLASAGMGIASFFHYDEFLLNRPPEEIDAALVRKCEESRPDMVLATWLIQIGELNVKPETYGHIRDELKIPVAMYWSESAPDVVRHADLFAPHVTVNVFVDTKNEWPKHTKHPEKCLRLFEPRDAGLFACPENGPRDIALSFLGTSFGRMDRALNLGFLKGRGVAVLETQGQRFGSFSATDYAGLLRRSLATLNFTSAVTFHHLTGRTIEACMAGALLLETANGETPELLEPYAEYVPFAPPFDWVGPGQVGLGSADDLVQKIAHYTGRPEEARAIAERGRKKALERCDGGEFWTRLFEVVGVK